MERAGGVNKRSVVLVVVARFDVLVVLLSEVDMLYLVLAVSLLNLFYAFLWLVFALSQNVYLCVRGL